MILFVLEQAGFWLVSVLPFNDMVAAESRMIPFAGLMRISDLGLTRRISNKVIPVRVQYSYSYSYCKNDYFYGTSTSTVLFRNR